MCTRTNLPQVPGMTAEETAALNSQRNNMNQMQTLGGQYGNVNQSLSGLYDSAGNINPAALEAYKQQVQNYQQSQQGIYNTALGTGQAENDLYMKALNGTGPVSVGLQQQKAKDFETFKQAAGQRGIKIQGDSFDNATSDSTAGIRMLTEQQKRYDLAADNERQALRQWGSTQSLNRMGSLTSFDPNANQMGYFNQATMGMMPVLSGINQGWSAYSQPYQQQRMAQFQRDSAQAQADAAWKDSMWKGGGQLLGMGVAAGLAPFTGGMSLAAMPGIMGGMGGGSGVARSAPIQGQWQGSYNQYAQMNGLDPNQYAPPSMRMAMGGN